MKGLYLPRYGAEDANRDIGDSTITETIGIGGFAMAAAPAIVGFVGGSGQDALEATRSMYDITWTQSANYQAPALTSVARRWASTAGRSPTPASCRS